MNDRFAEETYDVAMHAAKEALSAMTRIASAGRPEIQDAACMTALARLWSAGEGYYQMLLKSNPAKAKVFDHMRRVMLNSDTKGIDKFIEENLKG